MANLKHALASVQDFDQQAMEELPEKFRKALGTANNKRRLF